MKKLFIQFYLLLFVCFLVMSLLVGLVYKFTAERAGKQSLDDLMNSSLYLMRSELPWTISTRFCSVSRAATTCWQLVLFLIFITSIKCDCWISP